MENLYLPSICCESKTALQKLVQTRGCDHELKKKKSASVFHSPDISNFKPHTKGNCKAFVTARWEEKALEELGYRLTLQEKL